MESRVADLETDLLRAIDQILDLTQRLETQEKFTRKLLHLLLADERIHPPALETPSASSSVGALGSL